MDQVKLEAMQLIAAHAISNSLADVACRCDVCAVHEVRGGDVVPTGMLVRSFEVPLHVVERNLRG